MPCPKHSSHSVSRSWTEEGRIIFQLYTPGLSQQQIGLGRIRNTEVLLLLGRKWSDRELGKREPCVLGCNNLEWNLHLAKLEVGREIVALVQILDSRLS